MRVMGVDPGTIKMGVGVVESISGDLVCREQICIAPRKNDPMEIKKSVTDYGGSSKEQVKSMVSILLGNIDIDGPTDISDALAIAICHHNATTFHNMEIE